ncbi:hypothetical protein L9W92_10335 [Pelotomaculum terephthalicicum JT]|uniref:phage late control D family protein n=1 Tax=Pelotomaculum terephthalicicum TaxID=206393 RepID=UPI001F03A447|nr:contractile injection system protein, VgrG/Pvc8 family [Pelotomaculum terephthalicicum]MCG9968449.1 hypothetical protein [Pelotomaculum terephthalicicum JT]
MGDVSLNNNSYGFDELAGKYRDFYAPYFKVRVEGEDLVGQGVGINSVKVDTSVEKADSFSFTVINAYNAVNRDFDWLDQYFSAGKNIEITMGYADKLETVFIGLITSVKIDFPPDGNPTITVGGMDATFKMMRGVKSRSWMNKKHSEVVSAIAGEYALKTSVDTTSVVYDIVEQSRATDYQFLSWMARENNYEFFVAGKTAYFRKPHQDKTPVITLELGKNLHNLSVEIDIVDQIAKVDVRGYDEKKKEEIAGVSGSVNKLGNGAKTGPAILSEICPNAKDYIYTNVTSKADADEKATAVLNERAMQLVSGSGESIGLPEIRAGKYIKVAGAGSKLNQVYYLKSATHTVDDSGYFTAFTIGGNAF